MANTNQAQPNAPQSDTATTANQLLQDGWSSQIDSQTAQQFTGLAQVRQARSKQLQREAATLLKTYGPKDPGVLAVQASLQNEQTFASRLGVVSATTSITAPTAPANGWVVYGHVRNADLTPGPQLTVFLADQQSRAWLMPYGYAFTDQTGYFTLSYAPSPTGKPDTVLAAPPATDKNASGTQGAAPAAAGPLTAFLEVSNPACKLVYVDATAMSITGGATIYRDIVLSAEVPLGTPPCEPGAPASVPPAKK
jgi:hypothetical protein